MARDILYLHLLGKYFELSEFFFYNGKVLNKMRFYAKVYGYEIIIGNSY